MKKIYLSTQRLFYLLYLLFKKFSCRAFFQGCICIYFLMLVTPRLTAQPPYAWVAATGGTGNDRSYDLQVDNNGNVYSTGFFTGTVDFNPGSGTYNLTSNGSVDIFIQKLDSNGNFVWALKIGGTSSDQGYSIRLDGAGQIYIAGIFSGSVAFGYTNLTAVGGSNSFIAKLDTDGNFIWAKAFTGNVSEPFGLVADASGVYAAGYFYNTVDFDPGAGNYNLTSTGTLEDIFVVKLNTIGNFQWAVSMVDTETTIATAIAAYSGSVYITGRYRGTTDFDPGPGITSRTSNNVDAFIVRLNATNGGFMWVNTYGGTGGDNGFDIIVNSSGYIYTVGTFFNTVDFGTGNITSAGSADIFLLKSDVATGATVWAKRMGGTGSDKPEGIALDEINQQVLVTGSFNGTSDFDPGAGVYNLTSSGALDIFVQLLNENGNHIWAIKVGGTMTDIGLSTCTINDEVYVTGYFSNSVDFDYGPGTANRTSAGSFDAFVLKLSASFPVPVSFISFDAVVQNNCAGIKLSWATASEQNSKQFIIERRSNSSAWQAIGIVSAAGSSNAIINYTYADLTASDGSYQFRLRQQDIDGKEEFTRVLSVKLNCGKYNFYVYPNPVSEYITITAPPAGSEKQLRIYSTAGQLITARRLSPGNVLQLNTTIWQRGIYVIEITESGERVYLQKISKQ